MKPPIAYYGGKTQIAGQIVSLLPEHKHYVEPFAGSLAVLLAKRPSRMETVNDLDGDIVAFWRVLRSRPAEFERVCALTPHARAEHAAAYEAAADELEQARRVWVKLTQGRAGTLRTTGWRHYVRPVGTTGMPDYLAGYVNRIAAAAERLKRVSLECRPALDVIARYGQHAEVLLYVDPPYLAETRTSTNYKHEMPRPDQHIEVAEALTDCAASVVLSGYASPLYDDLYRDWHRCEIDTFTGQAAQRSPRTEVLWSNRPFPALHDALFEDVIA
ncbi:DNA adenine methylase [Actinomadura decatromicini]|uniref:DNA adenine methylase n=1 Tax=Actinomadura decatromicini TaxID=2604572 RepID=A0A5D3F859_9ACTN|nr:DNA adenine methylase [Actinomadura decatromicini]TYK45197.1 DNA adenine methylase [Actinomadura decatromicini]